MIGVLALGVYLVVIIVWTTLLKRNVGEAMMLGFLVAAAFNGMDAAGAGWLALYDALTDEIVYATVIFVFMGYLLEKAGVMERMINLLDALIGGRRGGAAYVSTVASAGLGSIVHNQAAIAATVGSVTIPWMERSKIDRTTAATIVAGNAGMGITFPLARQCLFWSGRPRSVRCWISIRSSCPCWPVVCGAYCTGSSLQHCSCDSAGRVRRPRRTGHCSPQPSGKDG